MATRPERPELLKGTLDLLVLSVIADEPAHGYDIARRIRERSRGPRGEAVPVEVEEGSLYPALHRLERRGQIEAHWGVSDSNRRAKFYRLSRSGRRELERQVRSWQRLARAVDHVLRPATGGAS